MNAHGLLRQVMFIFSYIVLIRFIDSLGISSSHKGTSGTLGLDVEESIVEDVFGTSSFISFSDIKDI
jgi:hypothetical protein